MLLVSVDSLSNFLKAVQDIVWNSGVAYYDIKRNQLNEQIFWGLTGDIALVMSYNNYNEEYFTTLLFVKLLVLVAILFWIKKFSVFCCIA